MRKFRKLFAAIMAAAVMMALCVVGASAVSQSSLEVDGKTLEAVDKSTTTFNDLKNAFDAGTLYYSRSSAADKDCSQFTSVTESQNGQKWYFYEGDKFNLYGVKTDYLSATNYENYVPGDLGLYILKDNTAEKDDPEPEAPASDVIEGPVITKNVKVADGITNPETDFTYTFTPLDNAPALSPVTVSVSEGAKTGSAKIDLAGLKDAANGTYKYKFNETAATPDTGWSLDDSTYYLTVNKLADGTYDCFIKKNNQGNKTEAVFENTYKTNASLSLTKEVENTDFIGEDAEYSFKINFTASSTDTIPNEGFAATKGTTPLNVKDGDIVTLKKGETLTFASLPAGIKYSIEETNANGAKKTTWKVDNVELTDAAKIVNRTLADNDVVVVTNTFDKSETGLATRIAPFVAMAVLAGGAVAAYFVVARKRQENE